MVKINMNNMIKHSNGLYEDKGVHHHYFYKVVDGCVHRYSKFLDKWILCLDTEVNKQIKMMEGINEYSNCT